MMAGVQEEVTHNHAQGFRGKRLTFRDGSDAVCAVTASGRGLTVTERVLYGVWSSKPTLL